MNVPMIMMPKQKAREKLESYRERLRKGADAEYEAAVKGYEALAAGKVLLDMVEVFATVPTDEKDRPALAIARADRNQVYFSWNDARFMFDARSNRWSRKGEDTLVVQVDAGRRADVAKIRKAFPGVDGIYAGHSTGYALIPMVPADARPNVDLKKAHVLWEVPVWADNRISSAPSDPYLVQHLAGSLWVVLAEWDLTPLERAITRGRLDR